MPLLDDVTTIYIADRGLPGDSADAVRMTQIEADHATLMARPSITSLDAVPDVDTTGVVTGDRLTWDGTTWVPDTPTPPVWGNITGTLSAQSDLNTALGAKSDVSHTHALPTYAYTNYTATGNLSSGTRTVATVNTTLLSGITYLVVADARTRMRGGGAGSSFWTMRVSVDGTTRDNEITQSVGGVPDNATFRFVRTVTGTGAAISTQLSIIYQSGDPIDVRSGELMVTAFPTR